MAVEGGARRRTGGRSARVVAAVHDAVNELVGQGNPRQVTVAEIAERAGVNPTSIYRRWGTLEALVLDVEAARLRVTSPLPDTGALRGDLLAYATAVAKDLSRPGGLTFLKAVLGVSEEGDPLRSAALRDRGAQMQALLDRARDRGEPALNKTDVYDCVLAPIYLRTLFGIGGLTKARLAVFVGRAIASPPKSR